jgi:hypothetical protein
MWLTQCLCFQLLAEVTKDLWHPEGKKASVEGGTQEINPSILALQCNLIVSLARSWRGWIEWFFFPNK